MPRDGSNIYHYPTGIEGIPDQVIESTDYNSLLSDVEQDLNTPRPIIAGGTGTTNAAAALAALGGESATQVVVNYDSYVWLAGSFYSAVGATSAPVAGHAFSGIAYLVDVDNIVVEARDSSDGILYIRRKVAGVWGAWGREIPLGATFTTHNAGTISSGSFTPNPANGLLQYYSNAGNHTIATPPVDCTMDLMVTNSGSAGIISAGGYEFRGDSLPSINVSGSMTAGVRFHCRITRINSLSWMFTKASNLSGP